ncbi:MAG: PEP/pyruvate-binding domain-containing protein [Myxococcota bacterium]
MKPVPLRDALRVAEHGGKAVALGAALRGQLPVPSGVALGVELVDAVVGGDARACSTVSGAIADLRNPLVAVRSSAVSEDSTTASFAGQHLTCLNVPADDRVLEAVLAVWQSARSDAALAYRRRLGIDLPPRVAVVVQRMVDPDCAGVMFTRDPRDGADHRIVEGAWGLGEAVVGGLVTPDRAVMARGGRLLEHAVGHKDIAVRGKPGGGTHNVALPASTAARSCLSSERLAQLEWLAASCERQFPGAHDIEWAFDGDALFLLQRRAVTA